MHVITFINNVNTNLKVKDSSDLYDTPQTQSKMLTFKNNLYSKGEWMTLN